MRHALASFETCAAEGALTLDPCEDYMQIERTLKLDMPPFVRGLARSCHRLDEPIA